MKKTGLSTKLFIALLAGAILGIAIHYLIPEGYVRDKIVIDGILYVLGQGFIRLMQMLVVPLVFVSLVCGAMSLSDTKTLGRIGGKTVTFYLCTTAIAVGLALLTALVIRPGVGLDMSLITADAVADTTKPEITEVILNIIPANPIAALASGNMIPIIFFSLLVGIMLTRLGNRVTTVGNFFSQSNEVMMEMTSVIMSVAPIGVFCLICRTFADVGLTAIVPMAKYVLNVILALGIQCFAVYTVMLFIFTGLNPVIFIKKFSSVMLFAFSTATSNASIPMSIDTLNKKLGVSRKISSFCIPLGATINMDGTSIMQGVAVVFIAQAYGVNLTPVNLAVVVIIATIASIGTAGVPSVGLVTLAMVLSSVGLPAEGIALIMGVDRILDMLRTAVNITGDAVCTTIIASQEKELNKDIYIR